MNWMLLGGFLLILLCAGGLIVGGFSGAPARYIPRILIPGVIGFALIIPGAITYRHTEDRQAQACVDSGGTIYHGRCLHPRP